MGRYDGSSTRAARHSKKSGGLSGWLVFILIVVAAVAGFVVRPLIDEQLAPLHHLLNLVTGIDEPKPAPIIAVAPPKSVEPAETLTQLAPPAAAIVLPELDSSDNAVRLALTNAAPDLAPWLATDALIRKFTVLANDFSQGLRIQQHINFIKLAQPFSVIEDNTGVFIASTSYERYNALVQALDSGNIGALVTTYQTFKPLLQQVFAEFSYPDSYNLDAMINKAAEQILTAPIIEGPIPLVKHALRYQFADPQLEALNPVHKQMLRMGADNTRLMQNKIRAWLAKSHAAQHE